MDGGFSEPSYISVGDPYVDCKEKKLHTISGKRQFLTTTPKKGVTGSNWGYLPREVVGLEGQYREQYKEESQYRLSNTKKNLRPNGFSYSSPTAKHCGSGDYFGSIGGPIESLPGDVKEDSTPKKKGDVVHETRNIITSPMRRGGYGVVGTLLGPETIAYMPDSYDAAKEQAKKDMAYHKEKVGNRRAFHAGQTMQELGKSRGEEDSRFSPLPNKINPEDSMTPKERVEAHAGPEVKWKPSRVGQSGKMGVFSTYENDGPDPFDETLAKRSMLPSRRNPVQVAMKDLPESMRERKAFKPSSVPKSKLTRGTYLMGITKHHV